MKSFYWLLIVLLLSVGQIELMQAAPVSPSGAEPVLFRVRINPGVLE
jgi:hypothetical protein